MMYYYINLTLLGTQTTLGVIAYNTAAQTEVTISF